MIFPGLLVLPFTVAAAAVWSVVAIQAWVSPDGN
jgi:hypothetical protein